MHLIRLGKLTFKFDFSLDWKRCRDWVSSLYSEYPNFVQKSNLTFALQISKYLIRMIKMLQTNTTSFIIFSQKMTFMGVFNHFWPTYNKRKQNIFWIKFRKPGYSGYVRANDFTFLKLKRHSYCKMQQQEIFTLVISSSVTTMGLKLLFTIYFSFYCTLNAKIQT